LCPRINLLFFNGNTAVATTTPHHLTPPFLSSLAGHTQTTSRLRMSNAKGSSADAGHSDLGWAILHEQHQAVVPSVLRTGRHKCAPLAAPAARASPAFHHQHYCARGKNAGIAGKKLRTRAIGGNSATRKFARPKRVDAGREAIGEEKGALLEGQQ
jgi:hypothetical protein